MDQELKDDWKESMDQLMELGPEKRKHFALLLMSLAKCYADSDNHSAVILINNRDEESLVAFSAGADEMQAADMVAHAHEMMTAINTADAPPKEMFN
jgi:hypothetical protein